MGTPGYKQKLPRSQRRKMTAAAKKERERQEMYTPNMLVCKCGDGSFSFDGHTCAKCSKRLPR